MNNIVLREATEEDKDNARRIHHHAYRDTVIAQFGPWDEKMQDAFFATAWEARPHMVVLYLDEMCGYYAYEITDKYLEIHEIVIEPLWQGKGLGTKLLKRLVEEALQKGVPVRLQVLIENTARLFYEKFGFKDVDQTATHYIMEYRG